MTPKEIGDKIREFRKQRNVTQAELAERINVSFQQVQKYEKGKTRISLQRLITIANALQIPVSAFFEDYQGYPVSEDRREYTAGKDDGKDHFVSLTSEEAGLIKLFRKISNKKVRQGLITFLKGIAEIEKEE
ncbi:MAG: helix-turn-helix transcriptional regulator [Spirochaetota bacterium]